MQLGDNDRVDQHRTARNRICADLHGSLYVGDRFCSLMDVRIIGCQAFGSRGVQKAVVGAEKHASLADEHSRVFGPR